MRKINEENKRVKRLYLASLKQADGRDEATLDKAAAALLAFEEALGFKPFKAFHRDWAAKFKDHLAARKSAKTGKPLGVATRSSMLKQVKAFFYWLSFQPGYKSRINPTDVRYFNSAAKEERMARAQRPPRYPSLAQCDHAFRLMPEETAADRRDKALFALWVMTGARAGALASLRIHHVDLVENVIYQDGREVKTKGAKTFEPWFFPVDPMYRAAFAAWFADLTENRRFGPGDALFPKQEIACRDGRFTPDGCRKETCANAQIVGKVIGAAFTRAGLHPFVPHSIRRTLAMLGNRLCKTMEEHKAWSQNLGHENIATTVSAYMPVGRERQGELIRNLALRE